jgi:1,4-alpha-glucan branching enzyme
MPTTFRAPSTRPGMGAVLDAEGCTFRVWAPFARRVTVGGDFFHGGNLEPLAWEEIPLARDGDSGCWSVFVEGAIADSLYKFHLQREDGAWQWRHDPFARDATSFAGNSVVVDRRFDWTGDAFQTPRWNELVIYELHVGTFNKHAGAVGTFDDAVARLGHVAGLGCNAVEVLPAFDFDTATSMGYNTALPFAVDNAYGELGAMKRFVREAHRCGLAVILDVVYNHWGPEGLDECLGRFDGWAQNGMRGIYFYNDWRGETRYGADNRPDFGRGEVRQYVRDNAMTLLDELRADGLRLDATFAIRHVDTNEGDKGELPDGRTELRYLGEEKRRSSPGKILIAEDLMNDADVVGDPLAGGVGLDAQWDSWFAGRVSATLLAPDDGSRRPSALKDAVEKSYNRSGAFQRVVYFESHDEARSRGRVPGLVAPGDSEGWLARKISALGASLLLTAPGIPMLFMGSEFLEWRTWSDGQDFCMDWDRISRFPGYVDIWRRLARLRRNWEDNTRGLRGANTRVYWASDDDGVIAYHRFDRGGPGDDVVVVANLRNRSFPSYSIGFPRPGTWYLRFDSDARVYCGDFSDLGYDTTAAEGASQGMPCRGNVGLGPYSLCIYSQ